MKLLRTLVAPAITILIIAGLALATKASGEHMARSMKLNAAGSVKIEDGKVWVR